MFGPVKSVALHLTQNCNLRCNYCYSGDKKNQSMSLETARKSMDFIGKNSRGRCIINFFGGEPLLKFDLIKKIVSDNLDNGDLEFRLSTNGTLLDKVKLEFIKNHNITFALSIDGNEKQHNFNRRYNDNSGSYLDVIENLQDIFEIFVVLSF